MSNQSPILTHYSLSPQQQGMFFETEISEDPSLHLEQSVWRIEGKLDRERFKNSWQAVHDRHDVLRTCFSWGDDQPPVQIVLKPFKIHMKEITCGEDPSEIDQTIETILTTGSEKGFKLHQPPLSRLTLITVADDLHFQIWEHHHILLDGWSVKLIADDLMSHYEENPLSKKRSYKDYIDWLQKLDNQQAEKYWSLILKDKQFATTPGITIRQTNGSENQQTGSMRCSGKIETSITNGLRSIAKQNSLTLNHLLKSIWAALLSKWNQNSAVCYGVTVSGRPYLLEGSDKMTGLFINTVPETGFIDHKTTFITLADVIKEMEIDRELFESYTTGQIHQWSGYPGFKPLFESLLVFDEANSQRSEFQNSIKLSFEDHWYRGGTTSEPLTLLFAAGDEIGFECIGKSQFLNRDALRRIAKQISGLAEQIVSKGVNTPISDFLKSFTSDDPVFFQPSKKIPVSENSISKVDGKMVQIWKDVLGIDQIDPAASFFEMGGHSLLAIKIANRIRDIYSVEIPLKSLFQNPKLSGMTDQVLTIQKSMDQIRMSGVSVSGESEEGEL